MLARRLILAVAPLPLVVLSCTNLHPSADRERERPTQTGALADTPAPLVAVFSAFPAEMAPILAQAHVDDTAQIAGRTIYLATLRGVRVALGLTGIGLANARATAQAVLAALPVSGVVFSGVAGGLPNTALQIGDVAVPTTWTLSTGESYAASADWLTIASSLHADAPCFEQCTVVQWTGDHVCLDRVPALAVSGVGRSEEETQSSGPCDPTDANDVFGCDVGTPQGATEACQAAAAPAAPSDAGADATGAEIVDNETAAVAAEAAARGLPFIAFRSLSDGAGDPLGLPGFPGQFFAYYRLAARNAAATTLAFVARLAPTSSTRRPSSPAP